MNSDMKWFVLLIGAFVILPLMGMALDDWHRKDCRVELAKVGKSAEEIREICK